MTFLFQNDISNSNIVAVAATIGARLLVGPLCERFGPRKVMACLLIAGAIPTAMIGLVKSASGLMVLRFFIGILGATFVPCQFWSTQMFAPKVVGAANALAGGWGNMGAGITYLVMPPLYNGIYSHTPTSNAWKFVYIIPAGLCILMACIDMLFGDDCPEGKWHQGSKREDVDIMQPPQLESKNDFENAPHVAEVESISNTDNSQRDTDSLTSVNSTKSAMTSFLIGLKTCCQPTVLILIAQYACSFGLELSVDNIIAALFHSKFNLSLTDSSYVGSVFGLLNLFSRLSGGLFGDYLYKKFRLPGRILAQLLIFTCEGCFLIGFSYSLGRMDSSIIMMVFFSLFVQAAAGSTFSLAPFVDPANAGTVIGIVGAGGSLGGLCFNFLFKAYASNYHSSFLVLGIVALTTGVLGPLLLRVQNQSLLYLRRSS
ncbi:hypothetical protein VKS41_002420 [Umbelopsis sp. WA50703]